MSVSETLRRRGGLQTYFGFNNDAATGEHSVRHAGYLDAFEHRIVHAHVMGFCADGVLAGGIKNHQVGVASYCDCAFTGIEAEEFCRSRRNQFDEAVHAEATFGDTAGIDQAHAVFDPRTSVGNFGEVIASQFLLFFETERAMIG